MNSKPAKRIRSVSILRQDARLATVIKTANVYNRDILRTSRLQTLTDPKH
jgi:hypothetical protein